MEKSKIIMATKKTAVKKAAKKVKPRFKITDCDVKQEVPAVMAQDSPQEVLVIGLANNPRYVYASLEGQKVAVSVPAWMAPNLVRKPITIIKTPDSEHYEIFTDGN